MLCIGHLASSILVGLNGHLTHAKLDATSDLTPKLAHETFDGLSYVEFAMLLHQPANAVMSATPSFDNTLKYPTPQAVTIYPIHHAKIRYVGAGCTANEETVAGRGRPGLRGMFSQAWLRCGRCNLENDEPSKRCTLYTTT